MLETVTLQSQWNIHYEHVLKEIPKKIAQVSGVIVGFHSVTDGFKEIRPSLFKNLEKDPEIKGILEKAIKNDFLPTEIHTLQDLFQGFFYTMRRGKSNHINIRNKEVQDWLLENIPYERLQMGGTSGNMANALAQFGLSNVLVYTNPLTRELGELFTYTPNLKTFYMEESEVKFGHPRDVWKQEGILAVHWVWEFREGDSFKIGSQTIECPRNNRFYPCWNPINNKLQLDSVFKEGVKENGSQFSHFIVSGYHLLSEKYTDTGTTYIDYIAPTIEFLKEIRSLHPQLKIHLEFGSIQSDLIRKEVVTSVLPNVNSLGLNEVELSAIFRALGDNEFAKQLEKEDQLSLYIKALTRLMDLTGLSRIHFHNLGYYISLLTKDLPAESERDALIASSIGAMYRAETGKLTQVLEKLQNFRNVEVKEEVLNQMVDFYLTSNVEKDFLNAGCSEFGHYNLVVVPTRIVNNPVFTVGLGDTISALAFLYK